jgi:hypothetical protein
MKKVNYRHDSHFKTVGVFDRRADQGLNDEAISTSKVLDRYSQYFQRLGASAGNNSVVFPDATTLPEGWEVVILNNGDVALDVEDSGDYSAFSSIPVGNANRYTLLDNGSVSGEWFVEPMDATAVTPATRYVLTFNATTDWGSPSAGEYHITVLASTHTRGANPVIQFEETDGGSGFDFTSVAFNKNASGDIEFSVPSTIDLRFAGRVTLV